MCLSDGSDLGSVGPLRRNAALTPVWYRVALTPTSVARLILSGSGV